MYFLFKTAFWLSLVILLVPADPETKAQSDEPDISSLQAIGAAQQAYVDMTMFCKRNPQTCETGGAALDIFEAKARTGARMVYDYLGPNDQTADSAQKKPSETAVLGSRDTQTDRNLHTGSTNSHGNRGATSSDTLTPFDRQPQWAVPAPIRKPV